MKVTPLVFFMTSILVTGCGNGDSSPAGNKNDAEENGINTSTASTPIMFPDTIVPTDFNWEMQSTKAVTFKHVSNITQLNGAPLALTGKYYIEIYSLNENNKTNTTPFLKAMTTEKGEVEVLLTLVNSWQGITVKSQLLDLICINTLYKEQITATQVLGCDVVINSDLL